jgi:hypothetical protein
MGGVFNVVNLHVYHYAGNNPVNITDPTGAYDFDHDNKIIYTDLTIKDLDKANTILEGYQKHGYKVIARDSEGRNVLTFTNFSGMNDFMEAIDPSNGIEFVITIGATGSLGGGGTATTGAGVMIGVSSDGVKINTYTKIGGSVMVGAAVSGGVELGINFNTGNPRDLDGLGWIAGGSIGGGPYVGADISLSKFPGVFLSVGGTLRGLPPEVHAGPVVYFVHERNTKK